MVKEEITRYTAPGRYDVAPGGTICKVKGDGEDYELFVQLGGSLDLPNWQPVGKLFEKAFGEFISDQDFISRCLHLSHASGDRCEHFKEICKIITR
jgi:hypothetical protein